MRYEVREAERGSFEMDFEKHPVEGQSIPRGNMAYKVTAIVRRATETSPGIIEVQRIAGPGQYAP